MTHLLNFVVGLVVGATLAWMAWANNHVMALGWLCGFGVGFLMCFCFMTFFAQKIADGLRQRPLRLRVRSRDDEEEWNDDYWWNDGKKPGS